MPWAPESPSVRCRQHRVRGFGRSVGARPMRGRHVVGRSGPVEPPRWLAGVAAAAYPVDACVAARRHRCGPIIALRRCELPLTPCTKRQAQTHDPPVIRRQIPTKCGFSPFRMRPRAHQHHRNACLSCTVSQWSRLGSNQRPSACEAEAMSEARRSRWSSQTNWTNLWGSEHAIRAARRIRSG